MKDLEEQCACVKFCCRLGKTFTETFRMLQQAYGYMDTIWKQKNSRCSGWKNFRHDQKKVCQELLKFEGDVDSFFIFIGRALFIMSLFHVFRQSIKSFTWKS